MNWSAGSLAVGLRWPILAAERALSWMRGLLVPQEYKPTPLQPADARIALAFGLAGAAIAVWASTTFDPRVNDYWNIYFHADPNRVLVDTSLGPSLGFHRRGGVHPIFSILALLPLWFLTAVGLSQLAAFTTLAILSSAISAGLFYLAMRGLGLSILAATAFSGSFIASATFVHWAAFVETYTFALLTDVTMLVIMTSSTYRWATWALGSAGTLSVTITNWGLGLAAAFFHLSARRFVLVSVGAFLGVAGFALVQKIVMPSSLLFFNPRMTIGEALTFNQISIARYGYQPWLPAANARLVLLGSAVAPPPRLEDDPTPGGVFRLVSNQYSPPADSVVGAGAIACWIFLLSAGVLGAWRATSHRAVAMSAGVFVLFQLALYMVYGHITFLYVANFFPALLTLAALGWFTNLRNYVTCAAIAFTVLAGINNYSQFLSAAHMANETAANYPERYRPCPKFTSERLCVER